MPTFSATGLRLIVASAISTIIFSSSVLAQFELLNNGAVIANSDDTAFPTVIRVPSWVAAVDRAVYYMYFGNHSGDFIRRMWAASIDWPWTEYSFSGGSGPFPSRGVFDVGSANNAPSRDDYDHISAPDVIVDNINQRFVMYFHGERPSSSPASRVHERFVATSGTGLNFNDAQTGNGEHGHGPIEVDVLTDSGLTRDVWIGDDYMRVFEKNGRFYGGGRATFGTRV